MPSLLPIGHKNMTDFFTGNIQETDDKGVLSVNDNCWISMSVLEFHCSCAKLWGESCIFLFPLSFSFKFLSQHLPSHGLHECPLHSQFPFIVHSPSFQHPTELKSPLIDHCYWGVFDSWPFQQIELGNSYMKIYLYIYIYKHTYIQTYTCMFACAYYKHRHN